MTSKYNFFEGKIDPVRLFKGTGDSIKFDGRNVSISEYKLRIEFGLLDIRLNHQKDTVEN